VIVGHLDSATGPAVFYRPSSLRAGDLVEVGREDRSVVRFKVQRLATAGNTLPTWWLSARSQAEGLCQTPPSWPPPALRAEDDTTLTLVDERFPAGSQRQRAGFTAVVR
jgi:hypothetical protein